MHICSNEVSFQNQSVIGEVTHKFYVYAQIFKFYQYGTNSIFIFQSLIWDKPSFLQLQQPVSSEKQGITYEKVACHSEKGGCRPNLS